MSGRDIPIIFSAPMVRALLDGRKTMTRRLAWSLPGKAGRRAKRKDQWPAGMWPSSWQNRCPGDRLWVRETWAHVPVNPHGWIGAIYAADGEEAEDSVADTWEFMGKWRPSTHMPRWASRLTLIV
ncbi:MAG: hypothetical protein QOG83_2010, partial [Alphaproteobacteria bacterium]|nr:hypothetical protein [Alphaproteobacteria bacterium]